MRKLSPQNSLYVGEPRSPDTFDEIDLIADKFISQGYCEDTALEMAAARCEENDVNHDQELLQWN